MADNVADNKADMGGCLPMYFAAFFLRICLLHMICHTENVDCGSPIMFSTYFQV